MDAKINITIGVLALQGAFNEHIQLLRLAASSISKSSTSHQSSTPSTNSPSQKKWNWTFKEIRNKAELDSCDALIIPGGESTAISLVAERCGMLEPLREFVKIQRKPTWGTCAGLILLAEAANATKKGGQELIGGLDVRVNRNHFGRQTESFQADLELEFLYSSSHLSLHSLSGGEGEGLGGEFGKEPKKPFRAIFIRAPIVEKILPHVQGAQKEEAEKESTVIAPSRTIDAKVADKIAISEVEILGTLPRRVKDGKEAREGKDEGEEGEERDIIAVRQGNCFGTSFHPELTGDERIHVWWMKQVGEAVERRRGGP